MKSLFLSLLLSYPSFADTAACNDEGKVYKVCSNQEEAFQAAFDRAKASKKKLLVVFGAEWCPWCLSLHKLLSSHENLKSGLGKDYETVDIAFYQDRKKIPSGVAVLEKLKKLASFSGKIDGIPVLAIVNPKNEKAVLIDTEPLEKNTKTTKGHDPKKVMAAIDKATAQVK